MLLLPWSSDLGFGEGVGVLVEWWGLKRETQKGGRRRGALREEQREKEIVREGVFAFAGDVVIRRTGQTDSHRLEARGTGRRARPEASNSQLPSTLVS